MKKIKENKVYFMLFFFFFLIMCLSPISGDDWGNYIEGSLGIKHIIGNAIGMYFSWEGRFMSRLLINFLTYNKWLWNIVNSLVIVYIIYLINGICKFKNKKIILLLSSLIILLMNPFTFSQIIVWIAGNITYLFVIPLILLYIKLLYIDNNLSSKNTIIMFFLNLIIPMFVEHMGIILIFLNIIYIVKDYFENKKVNKKLIMFLVISIISFLVMFLSPGNALRSKNENLYFNQLSVFDKILYNIPNYIYYTYTINYFLIILMIVGNSFIIKNNIYNRKLKYVLYFFNCISTLFLAKYILIDRLSYSSVNIISVIYFLVYSIFNFVLLIKNSKDIKNDLAILFYIIGICANMVMLLSPTWGYRTSFATYLFMGISYLIVIDRYLIKNKLLLSLLTGINCISMLIYIIFYISVSLQYTDNYNRIKTGIKNKNSNIEIISYPSFAPCNINPNNSYHLDRFKKYYGIDKDTSITIVDNNWKLYFIYRKSK